MRGYGRGFAVAFVFGGVMCAAPYARAEQADSGRGLRVNWGRVFEAGAKWLHGKGTEAAAAPLFKAPSLEASWFGKAPRLSVLARDWRGAQELAGGELFLTDLLRLSRSQRMLIGRVRLADGKLIPFAQIGLGQWRVDTDFLPILRPNTEAAGQIGGGFEYRVDATLAFAAETDFTVLYRESHEPEQVVSPRMWGGWLAARWTF